MMHNALSTTSLLVGSYLLGSLPFGLWIAKRTRGIDIRTVGSGNIGATNVWRACGWKPGLAAFALDVTKGLLPPLAGSALGLRPQWIVLAALLAIVGHTYSILLRFRGGKGIATGLGAVIGIAPPVAVAAFGIFGIVIALFRYISLGSICGALSLIVLMPVFYPHDRYRFAFAVAAALIAVYKHRANIWRIRSRTEPKVRSFGRRDRNAVDRTHAVVNVDPRTGSRTDVRE
jgi:glycerol-3-phosphate acyltransferase PlsY